MPDYLQTISLVNKYISIFYMFSIYQLQNTKVDKKD
jgi:hypothetical protein